MNYAPGMFAPAVMTALVVVLLVPVVFIALFRFRALRQSGERRYAIWYGFRRFRRFILLTTVAAWWSLWDATGGWGNALRMAAPWLFRFTLGNHEHLCFSVPPIAILFVLQLLNYSTDKAIADLHWPQLAIVRQAWWSVVQYVIPMLMIAAGFEALFAGRYFGILWIIGAAITHRIGMVFLRLAEGMRFHTLKSGELRNQSLTMARRMGIDVQKVCMVPAGKGHLTNAYGGSGMIALTDTLPKYLNRQQIDSVIAHELIHVKHKHARFGSLVVLASFMTLMLLMFNLRGTMMHFRPLLDLVVVYGPVLGFYYFSRRAEFEADREAVLFTGDPETAIRSLVNLYRSSSVPVRESQVSELFQTHPSLKKRVLAIARVADLPEGRMDKIMKEVAPADVRP
jgi:Zn-dependent protease with chaperone function